MRSRASKAAFSARVHRYRTERPVPGGTHSRRVALWFGGLIFAALIYFGVSAFYGWKHQIGTSGGLYFVHRVEIPVPVFQQDDPRWTFDLLGPTYDTVGEVGCAITSAAMVLASYGVDTDPKRLNEYLSTHGGYTPEGWVYWEKAAEVAPEGQVEKAYEDLPSYSLIDQNLLNGNPVIVRLKLRNGDTHFVVLVGKDGWDYLTQDPAHGFSAGVYPLKKLTDHIEALRFYRIVPATATATVALNNLPDSTAVASPSPSPEATPASPSDNQGLGTPALAPTLP